MRNTILVAITSTLLLCGQASANTPFFTRQAIRPADGASSVAVADFDNDGVMDLAYTAYTAGTVTVWHSSYPAYYVVIATGFDSACSLVAGDVNRDGDIDLVAAKRSTTSDDDIVWYENPGTPGDTWAEHPVSGNYFSEVRAVDLTDFDGDGDLDILLAGLWSGHGMVSWFLNGDGVGGSWNLYDISQAIDGSYDAEAIDLDLDGDIDVVAAGRDANKVVWLENLNPSWTVHDIATGFDGASCVTFGDLDDDGDMDVIAGAYLDNEIKWFENRVNQGLSWAGHSVDNDLQGAYSTQTADLDLDGDIDILAAGWNEGAVTWYENLVGSWSRHDLDETFAGARSAVAIDRDGDGDLDVIAAAQTDDNVSWWENLSNRMAPTFPGIYYSVFPGINAMSVAMADMDHDGHLDLIAGANNATADADVLVALWDNGFDVHVVDTDLAGLRTVRVADINGDSWPDIVAAAQTGGVVHWYRNNGDGVSYTELSVATYAGARGLDIGDLDCDGDLDVIATSTTSDEVSCWFNNGDGSSFSAEQVIAAGITDPATVRVADMNRDGDLDVVYGGMSGTIWYSDNSSCSGTSWSPVYVASGFDNTAEVDVGDADGDGWQDIVVASSNADRISVLLHEGGSSWDEQTLSLDSSWTAPIAARFGDLDSDGDLDVVAADHAADEVTWFRNNGTGSFTRRPAIEALDGAFAIALGDWDTDGRLDVASAAEVADTVHLRPNRGGQFGVANYATAPAEIIDGDRDVFFTMFVNHASGRSSDLDIELRETYLRFENTTGTPLTSAQANAIVDRVEVWAETDVAGSGWNPNEDQLVHITTSLTVDAGGDQELLIIHGSPRVGPYDTQIYYIVLEMTDDASSHASGFVVDHHQSTASMMRYWDYSTIPLRSPTWQDAEALVSIVQPLFADDFESGSTSAWSSVVP